MSNLPTNRTTGDTAQAHVDDHNEVHRLHNVFDGTAPATFEHLANKGVANGYPALNSGGHVPLAQIGAGTPDTTTFLRGDSTWQVPGTPAGLSNWSALGNIGAATTVTGDTATGAWSALGNIGASAGISG